VTKPKYLKYFEKPQTRKKREQITRARFERNGISLTNNARNKYREAREKQRQLATAFREKSLDPNRLVKPSAVKFATCRKEAACRVMAFE
jgi:Zn-dependent oligopeptidase